MKNIDLFMTKYLFSTTCIQKTYHSQNFHLDPKKVSAFIERKENEETKQSTKISRIQYHYTQI